MTYRYSLDHTSKKITCDACGQKTAKRYIDFVSGTYLPDNVQRCDRQNHCGHCYSPKDYFRDNPDRREPEQVSNQFVKTPTKPVEYIPYHVVTESMHGVGVSNLFRYINRRFPMQAEKVFKLYQVGRSSRDSGTSTVFWQIDGRNRVRYGKIICYDERTGRRKKEMEITSVPKPYKPEHFLQTFFGTHLLEKFQKKPVAIVESEKTALMMTCIHPEYIWLATGGSSGCRWREPEVYEVLRHRNVTFFPDFGFYTRDIKYPRSSWMTCYQEWRRRADKIAGAMPYKYKVSRILEDYTPEEVRERGDDVADYVGKIQFLTLLTTELVYQPEEIINL